MHNITFKKWVNMLLYKRNKFIFLEGIIMLMRNWKAGLIYSIVMFLTLFSIANKALLIEDSHKITFFTTYLFIPLFGIIFGCLLGVEHLLEQYRLQGKWKIKVWKVIFIGIPSLILSFYTSIYFIPLNILPKFIESIILSENKQIISTFSAVLLGYTALTSVYKESNNLIEER